MIGYYTLRIDYYPNKNIDSRTIQLKSKEKLNENSKLVMNKLKQAVKQDSKEYGDCYIRRIKLEEITEEMYKLKLYGKGTGAP